MFRTSIKTCGTSFAHDIRPATVFKHHSQHAVLSGKTEQKLESGGTVRSRVVRVGCLCAQVVDVRVWFFFCGFVAVWFSVNCLSVFFLFRAGVRRVEVLYVFYRFDCG